MGFMGVIARLKFFWCLCTRSILIGLKKQIVSFMLSDQGVDFSNWVKAQLDIERASTLKNIFEI